MRGAGGRSCRRGRGHGRAPQTPRRNRSSRFFKAIIYGAKGVGATHLLGATDAALHRWLVHFGFPYRLAGPEADYYGRVALYTS